MRETSSVVLAKFMSTVRVLWTAFVIASLIYGFVAWMAAGSPDRPYVDRGPLVADPLFFGLALAAVAAAIAERVLPRLTLSPARLRAAAESDLVVDLARNSRLDPADIRAIAALPESEQRTFKLYGPWQTAMIIRWACSDVIALRGLILAFLRHDPALFAPFGAVSVVLLLLAKPRLDDLLALTRAGA